MVCRGPFRASIPGSVPLVVRLVVILIRVRLGVPLAAKRHGIGGIGRPRHDPHVYLSPFHMSLHRRCRSFFLFRLVSASCPLSLSTSPFQDDLPLALSIEPHACAQWLSATFETPRFPYLYMYSSFRFHLSFRFVSIRLLLIDVLPESDAEDDDNDSEVYEDARSKTFIVSYMVRVRLCYMLNSKNHKLIRSIVFLS
jgi:hypothetical protein